MASTTVTLTTTWSLIASSYTSVTVNGINAIEVKGQATESAPSSSAKGTRVPVGDGIDYNNFPAAYLYGRSLRDSSSVEVWSE